MSEYPKLTQNGYGTILQGPEHERHFLSASRDDDSGSTKGYKADKGKPRMDLIDPAFTLELAQVLTMGSDKYDPSDRMYDNNWRQGFRWGRAYAALQRHLAAFWSGEEVDPESGLSHLAHAACNVMFLHNFEREHQRYDDRPKPWREPRKIYLDIDGVMANWIGGINVLLGHRPDWSPDFWQFIPRGDKLWESGQYTAMLEDLRPLVLARDLNFEPAGYVTHRNEQHYDLTKEWLLHHDFPVNELHVVPDREDKAGLLKDLGCDLFIDDNYETFVHVNNTGIHCLLMDQPWNRKYEVGDYRLMDLTEVRQWAA